MNKLGINKTLQYWGMSAVIALAMATGLFITNAVTDNFVVLYFVAFGISFGGWVATRLVAKSMGRQAIKSKRAAAQKLLMLLIMALFFAGGFVAVIISFLTGGGSMIVEIDGGNYISVDFLVRYIIVYGSIYGAIWIITGVMVNS